jgi:Pyruvate/2-oxoacid:ferredoxin oxidoreductase gamma subunit
VTVVPIPCTEIALALGSRMVKNTVALGALEAATRLLPEEAYAHTLRAALKSNTALLELNLEAFRRGQHACEEALSAV